jgi:polysaccharide deacetylase family protein (PEP-CTERM system associated)
MTADELRYDLEKSISILKGISGNEVKGYRAPNFSISKRTEWAFYVLKEFGFVYDSSVQPFGFHPQYGDNSMPLAPFRHQSGIIEVPLSCFKFLSLRIPCSGGAYFRHFPYTVFRSLFNKSGKQNSYSTFYIHPWEFGFNNNPTEVKGIAKYRKYHNSDKVQNRLNKLLGEFHFSEMNELINSVKL